MRYPLHCHTAHPHREWKRLRQGWFPSLPPPPPSLFFICQVNNLNFKPWSVGKRGLQILFFLATGCLFLKTSCFIWMEFVDAAVKNCTNLPLMLFRLYLKGQRWVGSGHSLGTKVPEKKMIFRQRQGSSFGFQLPPQPKPTIHLPEVLVSTWILLQLLLLSHDCSFWWRHFCSRVILILMKFRILILACCHVVPTASLVSKLFLFSLWDLSFPCRYFFLHPGQFGHFKRGNGA